MRIPHVAVFSFAVASIATIAQHALGFGGTARELERKGNFAITNDAGFSFSHQIGNGDTTAFTLRPALEYFVIDHLSVGGAVEFDYTSARGNGRSFTNFSIAPQVGYEVAISDTWSVWPTLSLPLSFPNPGDPNLTLVIFVPFLIHPAEHFFFGIGPGFAQGLTSNPTTFITGGLLIGGYFDH